MATRKSTQPAPNEATENLFGEIANAAYCAELRLRNTALDPDAFEYELDVLRAVVARVGWIADFALKRIGGSVHSVHGGDAAEWLLSPRTFDSLDSEVRS